MVAYMPPVPVGKPTAEFPLRYGLLQAAVGPLTLPEKARGGSVFYNEALCSGGQGYEVNCTSDLDLKDFNDAGLNLVHGFAFQIISNYTCALSTDFNEGFAERMAIQKFLSVEQAVLEQIFSTSTFGMVGLSGNPGVVTVTTTATEVVDVISELESEFYCATQYGPPAYLHMPIQVFNRLKSEHLIEFDGLRWRTPMGSVVSAGCYAGNEPDGDVPADGTFWVYATGQTAVWRTSNAELEQPPVQGALNRTTNQYTGLVEREYAVTFECAVYAAPVTLWTVGP